MAKLLSCLMDFFDLHWTAGFLEGEGSFFLNKNKRGRHGPVVKATQTDPECLYRLRSLYGGSIQYDQRLRDLGSGSKRKPLYEWRLTGQAAIQLMSELKLLMSSKRQSQIETVLSYNEIYRSEPTASGRDANGRFTTSR
jgi:hypothetical protein